jgi:hypothetical protein
MSKLCGDVGMSREIIACYRLYAGRCVEIAQRVEETSAKLALLDMAQAWELLAEQAAKNSETVIVYETPDRKLRPREPS